MKWYSIPLDMQLLQIHVWIISPFLMLPRPTFALVLLVAMSACKKNDLPSSGPASAKTAPAGVSIEQVAGTQAQPVTPSSDPPPAPGAIQGPAAAAVGKTNLAAEARLKRNLAWLKILSTGTADQKQKVQDQMTLLDSEQLHEITELYQKQKNPK